MKKKLLAVLLIMAMCMSTLTGCAQIMYGMMKKNQSTEVTDYDYDDLTIEEDTEEDTEDTTETPKKETPSADVDFEVAEGSLENPAKIGEWVETKTYAVEDDKDHTVYYRITDVIRGDEAKKVVDEYNAADNYSYFEELEYDELEFCYITYEVYYPSDFPEGEYGIFNPDLDFNMCNLEDSGSIKGYIGLSTVWDISEEPEEFHAGETFAEGKAVFAMVKDFSDYLITTSYFDDDSNEICSYVKGK